MINLFSWDDALATGFDDVDLQHKKLLLIIEDVKGLLDETGKDYELRMAKDLKRLTDYTAYHFGEEESLMERYGYPGLDAHRKEHAAFVARVRAEIASMGDAKSGQGFQFYRFLGTWLLNHIAKSDQTWAAYIRERTARD